MSLHARTNPDPWERIAELEEEVAYLRRELNLQDDADRMDRLRRAFRLTPYEAKALERLRSTHPRPLAAWRLTDTPTENETAMGRVYVCRLRHKLGKQAIRVDWGIGYTLSPEGVEMVDRALSA